MDIITLENLKFSYSNKEYNIYRPNLIFFTNNLAEYVVQQYEEMRIDSVMLSIYNDDYSVLGNVDIILFINGIDNPLNINVGDIIKYPPLESFDTYRYEFSDKMDTGLSVRKSLSVPSKVMRKDNNRRNFKEDNYHLPPVVLSEPKQPVRLKDGKIEIGGLN
jgi:hypothetical protein